MFSVKVDVALWFLAPRPIPVLRIHRGPLADKPLAVILGEYASRVLAATPKGENWTLSLGRIEEENYGIVAVETLRGDKREVLAALDMLHSLVDAN